MFPLLEMSLNTEQRQMRSALNRVSAPAAVLVAIYLLSGLCGNLHMVLVDHHDALGHGHEHHAATCPVTEWTASDGCGHHHVLADHDMVEAGMVRSIKAATQTAVLPVDVARNHGDSGDGLVVGPDSRAPGDGIFSSTPIRAPPADLLSA